MNLLLATEAHAETVANEVVNAASGAISVVWLVPLLPLLGFVLTIAFGRRQGEPQAASVPIAASVLSFVVSAAVFVQVLGEPATYVRELFTWIEVGGLEVTFDLLVDQLTAVMLLVVTGVGSLVHIYSVGYMHGDERFGRYFAYLNLFLFSMLVLVLGSSFLTLFLGWELVGLSSYLLIGFWFERSDYASAAKKAFITNRVGDVAFMIGMFLIFATFGTLDLLSIFPLAEGAVATTTAAAIALLLFGGATAKSAQIPLYVWLPDAMAGPTPVSALIHAATMVTAGVYLMVRASGFLVLSIDAMQVVAWTGVLTALVAALIAIRQDDIKKVLAYSTVSQLGYMFVAVGTGGFTEGIFHLVTHAFFKGLLFLAAGSVMHALANRTDIWRMGGLRRELPITFWTSAAAWLAISGVPPFAGFFSKDQVLTIAYEHGFTAIWAIALFVAVLTAFYMSRWFFLVFLGQPRWRRGAGHAARPSPPREDATGATPSAQDAHEPAAHPHESPPSMTVPLVVLGVLSVVGGALNLTHDGWLAGWLGPVTASVEDVPFAAHGPLTETTLIGISVVAAAIGIGLAYLTYLRRPMVSREVSEPIRGAFAEALERKLYVDDLYALLFVRLGGRFADLMAWFDRTVIDGLVTGSARATGGTAQLGRRVQTGLVRGYVASVVLGVVVLIAVVLLQVR